jgi:uncharacterized protein (TIGR02246 family)
MPTRRLAQLLLLTALAACARHAPAPGRSLAARTPEECDRLFGERLNAGDVDGLVALYEPGATLVRQDGSAATGTAAIRQELAGLMTSGPHIAMHVVRVVRGGDDVAVLHNDWQATATGRDGEPVRLSGRALEVVRRQPDGTWRFVIDDPDGRGAAKSPLPASPR